MAYIGKSPVNGFFAKQDITTDGSTTTFALDFTVSSTTSIIVSVGGVIQEPDVAYTLSGGNTSIVFSTAPASTLDTYIQYLGQAIVQTITDLNGTEMVIDVDGDTTMTADTDDQIDFKLGGSDVIAFKTTGIHLPDGEKYVAGTGDDLQLYHDGSNSYIANAVGALKVATETSGIAVTIGHSTSEVTFGDNVTVTGNLTIGGTTNFGDFNITNVGSIALDTITNDGTDITLDSSGDIILDAAGNDIFFKAGGTTIGEIENESNNLIIKSSVSDADLILRGNDGGSEISALTFDMSAAGKATFNDQVVVGDGKLVLNATAITATGAEVNLIDGGATVGTTAVASGDGVITNDGGTMRVTNIDTFDTYLSATTKTLTNKTLTTPVIATISSSSNDMTLDAGADIILDADGADVLIKDGGTHIGNINLTSSNLTFKSIVSDKDMIFQGNDGGAGITALTLDMSAAGAATFNNAITSGAVITSGAGLVIADSGTIGSASDTDAIAIASNGQVTLTQTLIGTALDISGDADIDGTLEADAITVNGVTLAETISDTVGAMVGSNTETGITVTYQDGDNTLDFALGAAQTTITSLLATDIKIGEDDQTKIDFETADTIHFYAGNQNQLKLVDGGLVPITDNDVDLGTASLEFKNVYVDGTVFADAIGFGTTAITLPSADGSADQVLTTDGSGTLSFVDNTGGTSWVAIKTGAYTASAGEGVFVNTTSSAFAITLPASPSLGDEVSIVDYAGTFDSNACTIGRNSQPIMGVAEDLVVSTERASFTLVYVDGTQGWLFKGD
jgi:hypothetical protein